MRTALAVNPHLYIGDMTGRPLDYGKVYFGEPNKDPEFYQIDVFYDENLTIPAVQPVRTKGGFLNANGDVCEIFAKELTYSVKVLDQYGRKVFYKGDMSRTNTDENITSILPFPNAVPRPLAEKNADSVSVKDFGAKGDGVTDDTKALNNAFTAMKNEGFTLYIPTGTYLFSSTINIAAHDNICIKGDGRQKSILKYVGSKTTIDLIVVGDGDTSFKGLHISDINIDSQTKMTAGTALHIQKCQNAGNSISNVSFSNINQSKNLWDGIWFDNTNVVEYVGFEINVTNEALIVNGDSKSDSGSDLYLDSGTITFANVGVHCAGGFGGLYVGAVLFFGNTIHCVIDNKRASRWNREILFSDFCIFDGSKDHALLVDDPLGGGKNITFSAFTGSAGHIGTGGKGINIYIKNWAGSRFTINSGQIFNATYHNILVDDATTLINIGSNTQISHAGGYGIYSNVLTNNIRYLCDFSNNTMGDINPNISSTIVTPVIVRAASGTITNAAAVLNYYKIGSIVFFALSVSVNANGNAATAVVVDLPFVLRGSAVISGRADNKTGKMLQGVLNANTKYITIMNYDGSYPASDGEILLLSGSCNVY